MNPTLYTPEIAEDICERLADGATLRDICTLEGMPDERTVRRWVIKDHNGFAADYDLARQVGYLQMADELIGIADDSKADFREVDGKRVFDGEAVARSRLRVDTRKWLLSKALPKIYGDKLQAEFSGKDGAPLGFVLMGVPEPANVGEWLSKNAPPTGE